MNESIDDTAHIFCFILLSWSYFIYFYSTFWQNLKAIPVTLSKGFKKVYKLPVETHTIFVLIALLFSFLDFSLLLLIDDGRMECIGDDIFDFERVVGDLIKECSFKRGESNGFGYGPCILELLVLFEIKLKIKHSCFIYNQFCY